jgi:hypothetical protein
VTSLRRRIATRLLEGAHPWGWVQTGTAARGGWVTLRLTVYPPGTSAGERRLLIFARNWPLLWTVAVLVAMVALGQEAGAAIVPVCIVAWMAGIVAVLRATRALRSRVRSVAVAQVCQVGERRDLGEFAAVSRAVRDFERLDRAAAEGRIEPVEYERRWGGIYDAPFLAEQPHAAQLIRRR